MADARASSFKVLLILSVAVLLAHLALLTGPSLMFDLRQPQPVKAFTTRTVQPSAPPTAQEKIIAPKRVLAPKPQTQKTAPPQMEPAAELARDLPSRLPEAAPQPQAPASDATAQVESPAQADELASAPRPPRELAFIVNAISLPGSVRIQYKVEASKFPFSANAELIWKQDGTSYDARLELSAFGLARVQTSRGQITGEGLAPIRFSDKYRSEVAAHFNREQGKVTFSANTPEAPLLAGAQDRLSVLMQLAAMVAGDPARVPSATTVTLQVIGPRDADTWLFTLGDEETLLLPGGPQSTLKLVRNPRQAYDQKVELWLAVNLAYLPVRLKLTESNGDFIDQKMVALEAKP